MSEALQVALFCACIAVIVFVATLVPILFQAHRRLERLTLAAEHVKAKMDLLVDDGREMARSVGSLAHRASQPLEDVNLVRAGMKGFVQVLMNRKHSN